MNLDYRLWIDPFPVYNCSGHIYVPSETHAPGEKINLTWNETVEERWVPKNHGGSRFRFNGKPYPVNDHWFYVRTLIDGSRVLAVNSLNYPSHEYAIYDVVRVLDEEVELDRQYSKTNGALNRLQFASRHTR